MIADSCTKVATLTEEFKHVKWKSFTDGPQEYVFSDSMLSHVNQEKLQNTKVISMSGARVETLKSELQKPEYVSWHESRPHNAYDRHCKSHGC